MAQSLTKASTTTGLASLDVTLSNWDGTNDHNLPVAAGMYFCRMEAGEYVQAIELALVR